MTTKFTRTILNERRERETEIRRLLASSHGELIKSQAMPRASLEYVKNAVSVIDLERSIVKDLLRITEPSEVDMINCVVRNLSDNADDLVNLAKILTELSKRARQDLRTLQGGARNLEGTQ